MVKDLNIILLALGTPVIFLLFGIAVTIGGVIGVLFYVFGEMSRPDARGSISIKKHMRVWMYDLLGPKVYRWCGIVSFGFTTLLGIVFMIIGVVGLSGGSSHRHYSSRPNRPAQKQPHTPTTGKNTPSQKPNGPVISDKLGRMEGSPFFESAPEGSLLVGIQVSYATKGDYDVISSIQPLFCDDFGTYTKGNVYGIETDKKEPSFAKTGYAIGGMQARVGAFLDGVQIVYMKVDGDRLDLQKSYVSPWLGTQTDGELQRLLSKGSPYIGVSGACQGEVVGLKLLKK